MSIMACLDLNERAEVPETLRIRFLIISSKNTETKFLFYPECLYGLDKVNPLERGFRLNISFRSRETVKVNFG